MAAKQTTLHQNQRLRRDTFGGQFGEQHFLGGLAEGTASPHTATSFQTPRSYRRGLPGRLLLWLFRAAQRGYVQATAPYERASLSRVPSYARSQASQIHHRQDYSRVPTLPLDGSILRHITDPRSDGRSRRGEKSPKTYHQPSLQKRSLYPSRDLEEALVNHGFHTIAIITSTSTMTNGRSANKVSGRNLTLRGRCSSLEEQQSALQHQIWALSNP